MTDRPEGRFVHDVAAFADAIGPTNDHPPRTDEQHKAQIAHQELARLRADLRAYITELDGHPSFLQETTRGFIAVQLRHILGDPD